MLFLFFSSYSMSITAGHWEFDFKGWWYDFVYDRSIYVVWAALMLEAMMVFLYYVSEEYVNSVKAVLFFEMAAVGILAVGNKAYWVFLQRTCFEEGRFGDMGYVYEEIYGSMKQAKSFLFFFLVIVLLLQINIGKAHLFLRDASRRMAMRQVMWSREFLDVSISLILPLYLVWPGASNVLIQLRIATPWLWVAGLGSIIGGFWFLRFWQYKQLSGYYGEASALPPGEATWVVAREGCMEDAFFLYYGFLSKKKFLEIMKREKIRVLPEELFEMYFGKEPYLSLDIYTIEASFSEMQKRKRADGVFTIAYCGDRERAESVRRNYNYIFYDVEDVLGKILELKDLVAYRVEQRKLMEKLTLALLPANHCIRRELTLFRSYYFYHVNQFQVFDYSIKWLETVNYFYTLALLFLLDRELSDVIFIDEANNIEAATYGKWKQIRTYFMAKRVRNRILRGFPERGFRYQKYEALLKSEIKEEHILRQYALVWKAIGAEMEELSPEKGQKKGVTIEDLLHRLMFVRDYTRGHGVFTFEITPQINLALQEILVYLLNSLLASGLLELDMEGLRHKGWIIDSDEDVYFCYSMDRENGELEYNCFSRGTMLTFPQDFSGEGYEKR